MRAALPRAVHRRGENRAAVAFSWQLESRMSSISNQHDPDLGRTRGESPAAVYTGAVSSGDEAAGQQLEQSESQAPAERFGNWALIVAYVREVFVARLSKESEDGTTLSRDIFATDQQLWFKFVSDAMSARPDFGVRNDQFPELAKMLHNQVFGYGEIGLFLADPLIEDILMDNWERLDIRKHGKLQRVASPFQSERQLLDFLQTVIFAPANKEFTTANPAESAVLLDGSRIFAFQPPYSPHIGFAIRRHRTEVYRTVEDYIATGIAPLEMFQDLDGWVKGKRNMVFSGATGAGKTSAVNVAASLVPHEERIITMEDTPELQINHPRVLSFTTYEKGARAGSQSSGDVPMRDLLRGALRASPNRIIVGEVRDQETFEMLDTLNTGHAGSFTTLHSNSPVDAILRLQAMASRHPARANMTADDMRDLIASVIDLVLQVENLDGNRRITSVVQVIYPPHFRDRQSELADCDPLYERMLLRTLWQWDAVQAKLVRVNDILAREAR